MIEDLNDTLDHDVKSVLSAIQGYENIPRKRPKFINFCKNVLARKFSPSTIEKTWDIFEKALKDDRPKGTSIAEKEEDKEAEQDKRPKKGKKRKNDENSDENKVDNKQENKKVKTNDTEEAAEETQSKFDWMECVFKIVTSKGDVKMKKLKKKVINEYMTQHPDSVKTKAELEVKLDKKLKKSKKIKIDNDVISLATSRE